MERRERGVWKTHTHARTLCPLLFVITYPYDKNFLWAFWVVPPAYDDSELSYLFPRNGSVGRRLAWPPREPSFFLASCRLVLLCFTLLDGIKHPFLLEYSFHEALHQRSQRSSWIGYGASCDQRQSRWWCFPCFFTAGLVRKASPQMRQVKRIKRKIKDQRSFQRSKTLAGWGAW